MTDPLRIVDRAIWVDHGDGNMDGLTGELPIWADEWDERIVAAVNEQCQSSARIAESERDNLRDIVTELRTTLARVTALAETWDNTTELDTGNRSIVFAAFAAALRDALEGKRND